MKPPKIINYTKKSSSIPTDFSKVLEAMNSLKLVSKEANAILMEMKKNAQKGHESINDNSSLILIKKENKILEDLIDTVEDNNDKEELYKSFTELKDAFKKNTSWLENLGTNLKKGFVNRLEKNGIDDKMSILSDSIRSIKESAIDSLPPFWKGLYNIGSKVYDERQERKNRVYESVNKNLSDIEENNASNTKNTESTTFEDITSSISNNSETSNRVFEDITKRIDTLDVTQRQLKDEVSSRFDEIMTKILSSGEGKNLQEDSKETIVKKIENFMERATEEEKETFHEFLKTNNIEDLSKIQIEKLRNDEDFVKSLTTQVDTQSDEREEMFSSLQDNTQKESFSEKENTENFQRESIKAQTEMNENVKNIYKFISGKNFVSSSKSVNNNAEGGNILSKTISDIKNGILGYFGGKIIGSKIGQKVLSSNITKKMFSSKVGQYFLDNAKNSKLMTSIGIGNTIDNLTKSTTENLTKNATETISKDSVEKAATKSAEKVGAKTIGKTGAKALGKSLLKKISGVSLLVGGGLALQRILSGDFAGAAMELASGAAGTLPGLGTGVSIAMDTALAARDVMKESEEPLITSDSNDTNFTQITDKKKDIENKMREVQNLKEVDKEYLSKQYQNIIYNDDEKNSILQDKSLSELEKVKKLKIIDLQNELNNELDKEYLSQQYQNIYYNDDEKNAILQDNSLSEPEKVKKLKELDTQSEENNRYFDEKNAILQDKSLSDEEKIRQLTDLDSQSEENRQYRNIYYDDKNKFSLVQDNVSSVLDNIKQLDSQSKESSKIDKEYLIKQYQNMIYNDDEKNSILQDKSLSEKEKIIKLKELDAKNNYNTSKVSNVNKNTEELMNNNINSEVYTTSSTRGGFVNNTSQNENTSKAPTIINNYNTTNNTTNTTSSSKKPFFQQMLVNPVPSSNWQGTGWGGLR